MWLINILIEPTFEPSSVLSFARGDCTITFPEGRDSTEYGLITWGSPIPLSSILGATGLLNDPRKRGTGDRRKDSAFRAEDGMDWSPGIENWYSLQLQWWLFKRVSREPRNSSNCRTWRLNWSMDWLSVDLLLDKNLIWPGLSFEIPSWLAPNSSWWKPDSCWVIDWFRLIWLLSEVCCEIWIAYITIRILCLRGISVSCSPSITLMFSLASWYNDCQAQQINAAVEFAEMTSYR